MADTAKAPDIDKMSFEDALEELESIVKTLESGKGRLEDSISAYERGALLKKHCEAKLKEAQAKVEKISLDADGSARTEPADIE